MLQIFSHSFPFPAYYYSCRFLFVLISTSLLIICLAAVKSNVNFSDSDSLSDPAPVLWDQGSCWFMTSSDQNKQAVSEGVEELIPFNGPHITQELNPIENLWDITSQSTSSLMQWFRSTKRFPRTPSIGSLGASDLPKTSWPSAFFSFCFHFGIKKFSVKGTFDTTFRSFFFFLEVCLPSSHLKSK